MEGNEDPQTMERSSRGPELPEKHAGRWPLYLLGLIGSAFLIIILPQSYASPLLIALLIAALLVAARDASVTTRSSYRTLHDLVVNTRHIIRRASTFVSGQRTQLAWSMPWVTMGFVLFSAVKFRPENNEHAVRQGTILLLFGGVALGISLLIRRRPNPSLTIAQAPITPTRSNWFVTLMGVLLLVILAEINGKLLGFRTLPRVSYNAQFLLMSVGIIFVVWGLSGASSIVAKRERLAPRNWLAALPIIGLFMLALVIRIWGLDESIRGLVDETVALNGLFHIWSGRDPGLVAPFSRFITTPLYPYWQTGTVALLGHNIASFRATSALVGSLNIVALYLLAKTLFDKKTALIAAFLLATFPPHIHFSRLSLVHIFDPLFGTLALAFLARGLKYNRRLDWVLSGISLGLTQYFFEAGRLFFAPLALLWIGVLTSRQWKVMRLHWQGLVVATLAMLFVAMPVYYTIFAHNAPRANRLSASGLEIEYWTELFEGGITSNEFGEVLRRLSFPYQIFVHQPEIAAFYGGEQALILEYLVPLFLLGALYLIWRGDSTVFIVLLWIILTAFANSLLRDSAAYPRYVVVFPAIALVMAIALRYVLPMLWPGDKHQTVVVMPLMTLLLGVIGVVQVTYYFGPHLDNFDAQLRDSKPYRDGIDAVLRVVDFPPNTDVILISNPEYDIHSGRALLGFLLDDPLDMRIVSMRPDQISPDLVSTWPRNKNYAFFVEPEDRQTITLLDEFFELEPPQQSPYDIPDDKEYILYFAPRDTFETS